MKEDFLHYLWKFQKITTSKLLTTDCNSLQIVKVGEHNTSQSGPDFFNAQLIIDNQRWAGTIEIHLKSSDWYTHQHQNDSKYDNVILHVVWKHDIEIYRKDNSPIPTIELQNIVSPKTLQHYNNLFQKRLKWINCEGQLSKVSNFTWNNWLERLYLERLDKKSHQTTNLYLESNNNWEATCFYLIAQYFGGNTNGESFLQIVKSIPFPIIQKSNSVQQLEALFFGQANLLNKHIEDNYYTTLQQEYQYLKHKYKLQSILGLQLEFFRLRPSNFPTIRLAQLANLYANKHQLFSNIHSERSIQKFYSYFNTTASMYWNTHYNFGKESKKSIKKTTSSFIDILIINALLPLQLSYAKSINSFKEEDILQLISSLALEKNTIVTNFKKEKKHLNSALHSQALIHLKKEYCNLNNCLKCAVGFELLKE